LRNDFRQTAVLIISISKELGDISPELAGQSIYNLAPDLERFSFSKGLTHPYDLNQVRNFGIIS